jgi:alpha-galactosidase
MSSDRIKMTVVGAGSYVFGRSVLFQALAEYRLTPLDIVLVDPDREMLELLAGAGRRLIRELELDVTIEVIRDRSKALPGSDYVIYSAGLDFHKHFKIDCEVIDRHYGSHMTTEYGGVAGISYSLRQIALIEGLLEDMQMHCPEAWLLNLAKPLPRVCQFAQDMGINTAGFCSDSQETAYVHAWRLLNDVNYNYRKARERYVLTIAGLNHFGWLLEAKDRETGEDLLPRMRQALKGRKGFQNPRSEGLFRGMGYMPLPDDLRIQDFLDPDSDTAQVFDVGHGAANERDKQRHVLRSIAGGSLGWELLGERLPPERPVAFIAGRSFGQAQELSSINLVNGKRCPILPEGVFIETPARIDAEGVHADPLVLPKALVELTARTASVTDAIAVAARGRKMFQLEKVVALDPIITDKKKGLNALSACLNAHADLLW